MSKTVLLVVDIQQSLMDLDPWNKDIFIDAVSSLQRKCREKGIPVVFVRHCGKQGGPFAEGSRGWRIAPEVAPLPGEAIVDKRHNSAFHETGLQSHLDGLGCDTIILAGMQTEFCIDTTCKSAFEHGYSVTVPLEAHTTIGHETITAGELHEFYSSAIWNGRFAAVVPVEELLESLESGGSVLTGS